jgi:hypothetical protein
MERIVWTSHFFTNEAWFHLYGYFNSHNSRVWSATNPYEIKDTTLHDQKVGVWCVILRNRIIGPIFFSDTINSKPYSKVIFYLFIGPFKEDEISHGYFQKGIATAHTALVFPWGCCATCSGTKIFKGYLASTVPWYYALWLLFVGSIERRNLQRPSWRSPRTEKRNIANFIRNIPSIEMSRVFANETKPVDTCVQARGGHFQHLL